MNVGPDNHDTAEFKRLASEGQNASNPQIVHQENIPLIDTNTNTVDPLRSNVNTNPAPPPPHVNQVGPHYESKD